MKKLILLLGIILAANTGAYADCEYECVAPYDMNNKLRSITSAVTGFNSITENRVEASLEKEVLKIVSAGDLKIDIDSYSPKDLKNGIFKSMTLTGNDVVINDIYLSSLKLKSLCDFNYIKSSNGNTVFKEAFPMSFEMSVTENDLNKTMQNSKYQKVVKELNHIGKNYAGGLQLSSTKAAVKNNKFYYVLGFNVPFMRNEQKLVIQADMKIKNGRIEYCNTRLASGYLKMDLKNIDFIMNYLNPLDFSVNILQNKDAKISVKDISIVNNMFNVSGIIVIPKD